MVLRWGGRGRKLCRNYYQHLPSASWSKKAVDVQLQVLQFATWRLKQRRKQRKYSKEEFWWE